jgi:uncharacterized protein DUF1207
VPTGFRWLLTGALILVAATCAAQDPTTPISRCAPGVHESESHGTVAFPQDSIHCPLLADPKEPRSFVSVLRGAFRTVNDPSAPTTTIISVGIGDSFGLVRWNGQRAGDGVQIDVVGAIFAQFDFNAPSKDLINADYTIGFPITFRAHGFSTRVRVYHQSSHLGDEFLLRDSAIQRENLSFESIELLMSQEIHALRVYAGAERLFRREPDTVGASVFHGGAEFRSGHAGPVQMVAAVDVKSTELHDWSPAISGRAGIELVRSSASGHPARLVTLMLELYNGPSPYGQFFQDDISYAGFGIHFSL